MHLAKVGGHTLPRSEHTHLALPPTLINWFTVDVIKSRRVNTLTTCYYMLEKRKYNDCMSLHARNKEIQTLHARNKEIH